MDEARDGDSSGSHQRQTDSAPHDEQATDRMFRTRWASCRPSIARALR